MLKFCALSCNMPPVKCRKGFSKVVLLVGLCLCNQADAQIGNELTSDGHPDSNKIITHVAESLVIAQQQQPPQMTRPSLVHYPTAMQPLVPPTLAMQPLVPPPLVPPPLKPPSLYPSLIRPDETEEQRAKRLNRAFEKMMQFITIVGQVDSYLSDRAKSVIKTLNSVVEASEKQDREERHDMFD